MPTFDLKIPWRNRLYTYYIIIHNLHQSHHSFLEITLIAPKCLSTGLKKDWVKCLLLIWSNPKLTICCWSDDFQFCKPSGSLPTTKTTQQSPLSSLTLYFVLTSPLKSPFLLHSPNQIPSHPAVSQPIPSNSWVFWGALCRCGECPWVSQWTAGCCDWWTCWAAHYCCHWSSPLVMIPACHQSWHPLQTSQGGWKLNRGSLPCLWPKETCVYACSCTGVILYQEWMWLD